MNRPYEEDDDPPFDGAEKLFARLQVLLDARRDAELDERRELLAWEEERATNDGYERMASGWIGKEVA